VNPNKTPFLVHVLLYGAVPPEGVAVIVVVTMLQVNVRFVADIETVGIVEFWNIVMQVLEVHPFVPVTVTQYVPGALTVCVAPVVPPVHV